ncbi:MAG: efflux RND transporter periplasmic adaptor subunit [Bacteroidia bacterium]|nr:efflux RND transporter periplasmic adaptor subunit [Bacteroidia bacterium]
MKAKNIILVTLIIIGLAIIKIYLLPSKNSSSGGLQGQAGTKPPASIVTAFVVKVQKIENTITASGTVLANEEVELKPEIAGKIIQLAIKEDSPVTKGQLLVKINDAEYQAQLKIVKVQLTLAQTQLEREKQLLKINGISQQEVDVSENQIASLKADIDFLQSQIDKTELKAPFNGWIGLKNVSEGAQVSQTTVIATLQQIDPLKLDFSISERYFNQLKKGDKVLFSIDGVKKDLEGAVFAVEPKIDLATRMLKVRAICPNNQGTIFPGAFANVRLALGNINDAMMIPTEAIIPDMQGKKVFILKNGKTEFARVETGLRTEAGVQITNGLGVGDTVITTGIMQLKTGSEVKITELK